MRAKFIVGNESSRKFVVVHKSDVFVAICTILCDFQSNFWFHSWAVRREVSCLLYLYVITAHMFLTVCHCLRHKQMENITKKASTQLQEVGQEMFQIATLLWHFLTNMHHINMTFLYEVSL